MTLAPVYRAQGLPMLDKLTIESFAPHVGTSFRLHTENRKIELRLTRAAKVMESEAARLARTPFSLFFLAPVLRRQQIYRPTHAGFWPEWLAWLRGAVYREAMRSVKSARASFAPLEENLREWYALTPAQRFISRARSFFCTAEVKSTKTK